jgi:hypothetical protein
MAPSARAAGRPMQRTGHRMAAEPPTAQPSGTHGMPGRRPAVEPAAREAPRHPAGSGRRRVPDDFWQQRRPGATDLGVGPQRHRPPGAASLGIRGLSARTVTARRGRSRIWGRKATLLRPRYEFAKSAKLADLPNRAGAAPRGRVEDLGVSSPHAAVRTDVKKSIPLPP